mgnify:CR=1 FL=1|tara:strand:- start:225 stop:707 length:483 start_codon:yes stop_codon:yes gene_type:complete
MGGILVKQKLALCTKDTTSYYQFNNKKFYCKVIDIYDGDTITIAVQLNKKIYKYKVRMYGYDSPEMKPRLNNPDRDAIIIQAKKAKSVISELILNKIVVIHIQPQTWDKYGRLLGTIYSKIIPGLTMKSYNLNINEYMIEKGYGYPYYGGTKHNNLIRSM